MQGLNLSNEMFFFVFLVFIAAGLAFGFAAIYFVGHLAKIGWLNDSNDLIKVLIVIVCMATVALLFQVFTSYCVTKDLSPVVALATCIGAATGLAVIPRKQLSKNISRPADSHPPDSGQAHS